MADKEEHQEKNCSPQPRLRRRVSPVAEPEAADYIFDLIRSLIAVTRDYRSFRFTGYFLEMAAMEIASVKERHRTDAAAHESRRATS